MPVALVESQFKALEPPDAEAEPVVVIDAEFDGPRVLRDCRRAIQDWLQQDRASPAVRQRALPANLPVRFPLDLASPTGPARAAPTPPSSSLPHRLSQLVRLVLGWCSSGSCQPATTATNLPPWPPG